MSDIIISRPEVVTGHPDIICSTSIRHILAVRKSTLLPIDTLIRQLADGETGNRNESHHTQSRSRNLA
ncbi:restriction methylase [Escherichia coli]|nr:restriction methylase [Escherichia coli]GCY16282.1 restriction methylase [Escherichia coli]